MSDACPNGGVRDECGECGGDGFFVSCTDGSCQNMDCNGECKTGTLFECSGANCGGAVIDNCGVCAGGSTGKYINADYDACDICGGPNTDCSNGYDAQTCPNMDEYCGSCTGVADCLPKLNDIYAHPSSSSSGVSPSSTRSINLVTRFAILSNSTLQSIIHFCS